LSVDAGLDVRLRDRRQIGAWIRPTGHLEERMSNHRADRLEGRGSAAAAVGLALAFALSAFPSVVAAQQVRVTILATGDVGHYAGMCGAPAGADELSGVLELKNLDEDGSALYEGRLMRTTSVMACGTKPNPTEDQVAWCTAQLTGRSPMDVTLEIYEDDRGAWVKSEPAPPRAPAEPLEKQISGCTEPSVYLSVYPDDGWMSGLGIESVPSGMLVPGARYVTGNVTLTVH
jgi:hypothetical protein